MEKPRNYKTLEELEDKYFGGHGTPEREQYEFELSMEILGEKLKQIRKQQRLTQEQLGKLIGVQKAQISKLESGNNSATISTVLKVFHALKAKVKFKIEIEEPLGLVAP
ncbi:MAG: helix-turn-helix transcriptional regulator [Bacteroidota bacterium]